MTLIFVSFWARKIIFTSKWGRISPEIDWCHCPAQLCPFRHKLAHSGGQNDKNLYEAKCQVRTLWATPPQKLTVLWKRITFLINSFSNQFCVICAICKSTKIAHDWMNEWIYFSTITNIRVQRNGSVLMLSTEVLRRLGSLFSLRPDSHILYLKFWNWGGVKGK